MSHAVGFLTQHLGSREALAAYQAVVFCAEIGGQDICLKGDAKEVVDAINSQNDNWSHFGHIVADVRFKLCMFSRWQCGFVNQAANSAVYGLAKMAIKCVINIIWIYIYIYIEIDGYNPLIWDKDSLNFI